ncbi:sensory/regulatory protein rpfC [Verticillium alfalfae VaMs.102]|uniref:Sensory/regulatory protein rpfC n=1 Tax=Verticillium alfalfae (strain VaMs.102 / ATCC MYA-4576 / FGSC 10136) TaxID=526221 RepID=C9SKY4_VERA1|nr:sensory/regulatory protein rpfC [Verticillium alfalfae VaMs.102]EEY19352.1 sensory/regulatory protein rpfC [Verticillium alfalfae VaMs.102]
MTMALDDDTSLPVENAERARQREIAAYLSAASYPAGVPTGPPETPFINADPALNALVQSGTSRLDCDRSFLSLIDRENHFLAAEMTRSHSIIKNQSAENDHIFLGVSKLETRWGVCPTAMLAFMDETGEWAQTGPNIIANRTRFIVNDFRVDPHFVERPYVCGYPYMVSYLEVPLVSPLGYLLGSYCVVDNKPRHFNDEPTIAIMNEIASAIMSYLELKKTEQMRHRAEQLIGSLSAFVGCKPDPAPHPPKLSPQSKHPSFDSVETDQTDTFSAMNLSSASPASSFATPDASFLSSVPSSGIPLTAPPPDGAGETLLDQKFHNAKDRNPPGQHLPSSVSDVLGSRDVGFSGSANLRSTFFRAASMMRQAMNMDGFMFLDAAPSVYVDTSDPLGCDRNSNDHGPQSEAEGPYCAVVAQATVDQREDKSLQPPPPGIPEATLQRLIRRHPRGHVFSADEFGPIDEHYGPGKPCPSGRRASADSIGLTDDVSRLFSALPAAKYIIFLPLWHFQRECWYTAALGWVADPTRAIEVADISLVSAFGNSVMAEVSRWEALAASRAKSNFVSSISHELRSPLHGVLASSELLREGISDLSLKPALDMLDSCGNTLLDTFNHLLNHAIAINAGKNPQTPAAELRIADLGETVEDVVEAVHVSHGYENAFGPSANSRDEHSVDGPKAEESSRARPVLVSLNIQDKTAWKMRTDVGVWKRIIMNVFGNAMKYTPAGHIEVSLRKTRKPDSHGRLRDYIAFSVEDTGLGISSDYLKYQLFTPFSQENTHAAGMGLGLSIVQQLARGLGGAVNVKSSAGGNLGMNVILATADHPVPDADVYFLDDDTTGAPRSLSAFVSATNSKATPLTLLCPGAGPTSCLKTYVEKKQSCAHLHLPLGPRKLASAIQAALTVAPKSLISECTSALSLPEAIPRASELHAPPLSAEETQPLPKDIAILQAADQHDAPPANGTTLDAASPVTSGTKQKSLHLLLVDDNPINIKLLTTVIRKMNHTFATASNGLEAVELYEKSLGEGRLFDLVFMDISMPVMNGFEATREIRRLEGRAGAIRCKIVVLTGLSSASDRKEAVASGSDMFLTKPVKLGKVREVLDQELEGVRLAPETLGPVLTGLTL